MIRGNGKRELVVAEKTNARELFGSTFRSVSAGVCSERGVADESLAAHTGVTRSNGNGRREGKDARNVVFSGDSGTVAEFKTFVKSDGDGVSAVRILFFLVLFNRGGVPLIITVLVCVHRAVADGQFGDILVGRARGRPAEAGPTEVAAELCRVTENNFCAFFDLTNYLDGLGRSGRVVIIFFTTGQRTADNQSHEQEKRNQFLAHRDNTSKKFYKLRAAPPNGKERALSVIRKNFPFGKGPAETKSDRRTKNNERLAFDTGKNGSSSFFNYIISCYGCQVTFVNFSFYSH